MRVAAWEFQLQIPKCSLLDLCPRLGGHDLRRVQVLLVAKLGSGLCVSTWWIGSTCSNPRSNLPQEVSFF